MDFRIWVGALLCATVLSPDAPLSTKEINPEGMNYGVVLSLLVPLSKTAWDRDV